MYAVDQMLKEEFEKKLGQNKTDFEERAYLLRVQESTQQTKVNEINAESQSRIASLTAEYGAAMSMTRDRQ